MTGITIDATMTTGLRKSGQQRRQLNPAFAAAHGLTEDVSINSKATEENSSPLKRAKIAVKRARATGKLNVANIGLSSPLFDVLFDLRQGIKVNLSMNSTDTASWECFSESSLTLVDFSDNAIGGIAVSSMIEYDDIVLSTSFASNDAISQEYQWIRCSSYKT